MDFTDHIALVTGAGRGLGLAYAELLARRGASVVLHDVGADKNGAHQDPLVAEGAAEKLRTQGFDVRAARGPIDSRAGCRALIDETLSAYGRIDSLIHNAGWVGYQPIEELEPDFLARMVTLGVDTPLWLAQAAWPTMKAQGFGRLVLTTSDRALYPEYVQAGLAPYAAAKMAIVGITNVLAHEGAPHGIRVNAISPVAKTRMWGVEGEPEDLHPATVAPGAAFLVSDTCQANGWVLRACNGQFHAVKTCEAADVDYPRDLHAVTADSPEAVEAAWDRIAVAAVEPRG